MSYTNGQIQVVETEIHSIRVQPFNNPAKPDLMGKYGVVVTPHEQNASGIIAMTESQLRELAGELALSRWQTLASAVTAGDSKLRITYKFCQAGAVRDDNPEATYGDKDWWRREQTSVIAGDDTFAFLNKVQMQIAVTGETAAEVENTNAARIARRESLRRKLALATSGNPVADSAPDTTPDVELEEETPAPTGKDSKTK